MIRLKKSLEVNLLIAPDRVSSQEREGDSDLLLYADHLFYGNRLSLMTHTTLRGSADCVIASQQQVSI